MEPGLNQDAAGRFSVGRFYLSGSHGKVRPFEICTSGRICVGLRTVAHIYVATGGKVIMRWPGETFGFAELHGPARRNGKVMRWLYGIKVVHWLRLPDDSPGQVKDEDVANGIEDRHRLFPRAFFGPRGPPQELCFSTELNERALATPRLKATLLSKICSTQQQPTTHTAFNDDLLQAIETLRETFPSRVVSVFLSSSGPLQLDIMVLSLNGESITVTVDSSETVADLRQLIANELHLHDRQRVKLVSRTSLLEDYNRVQDIEEISYPSS
mmetsp:Transcript_3599/g.8476  ORF Transcript_3599/g.8476 Transcript_3599/m.8476 type:complete len:270 (-) Transcript_3599:101-910(-)